MTFTIKLLSTSRIVAPAAAGFLLLATGSAFAHGGGGGGNHGGNDIHMSSSMTAMKSGGINMSQDHVVRDRGNSGDLKVGKSDNAGPSRKHSDDDRGNKTSGGKTTGSLKRADDTKTTARKPATAAAANTSSSATTAAASTSGTTAPIAANPATSVALAMASAPLPGTGGTNTIHPIIAPAPLPGTGGTNTIHPIIASPPATYTLTAGPSLTQIGKGAAGAVLAVGIPADVATGVAVSIGFAGYGLLKGGLPEAWKDLKTGLEATVGGELGFIGSLF
jgi:hypothetical protein